MGREDRQKEAFIGHEGDVHAQPRPRKRQLKIIVLGLCLSPIALTLAWALKINAPTNSSIFPKCHFHQLTGLHCPGCGATRAVHSALNGRLVDAIGYNALLVLGTPLFGGLWWAAYRFRPEGRLAKSIPLVVFAAFIVFFVIRNVPSPEASPLAPRRIELPNSP